MPGGQSLFTGKDVVSSIACFVPGTAVGSGVGWGWGTRKTPFLHPQTVQWKHGRPAGQHASSMKCGMGSNGELPDAVEALSPEMQPHLREALVWAWMYSSKPHLLRLGSQGRATERW